MFRTSSARLRQYQKFFKTHKRLVLFLALLLAGFVAGCCLFNRYGKTESAFLGTVLTISRLDTDVKSLASAVYHSCFSPVLLLILLLFCGLSACGLPVILAVPVFFGMGVGMSEAYYYSTGWHGVLLTVVLLLPQVILKSTALLMASAESMRMTLLFSGQLLPHQTACGGLNKDFRLYILRFLIFFFMIVAAGITDVLLRVVCQAWLL